MHFFISVAIIIVKTKELDIEQVLIYFRTYAALLTDLNITNQLSYVMLLLILIKLNLLLFIAAGCKCQQLISNIYRFLLSLMHSACVYDDIFKFETRTRGIVQSVDGGVTVQLCFNS